MRFALLLACVAATGAITVSIKTFQNTDCTGTPQVDLEIPDGSCSKQTIGSKTGYAKVSVSDCASDGDLYIYATSLCLVKASTGAIDHSTYGQCLKQSNNTATLTTCA